MGKRFDKLSLFIILLVISIVIFYGITNSWFLSLYFALFTLFIYILCVKKTNNKLSYSHISKRDFTRLILLNGNAYLRDLIEYALKDNYKIECIGEHSIITKNGKRSLLYYAYKFSSLSEEDVARSYRLAMQNNAQEIFIFSNHSERKAMAVAEYIPQHFSIIGNRTLYNFLAKSHCLPAKESINIKHNPQLTFKRLISSANVKYFIFASFACFFIALFTPFKTYYLTFAFINILLTIFTLTIKSKGVNENGLFK